MDKIYARLESDEQLRLQREQELSKVQISKADVEQLMRKMKRIYMRETTIPEEKLDKLMKRDIYFSHKKCVKYGIVSPS